MEHALQHQTVYVTRDRHITVDLTEKIYVIHQDLDPLNRGLRRYGGFVSVLVSRQHYYTKSQIQQIFSAFPDLDVDRFWYRSIQAGINAYASTLKVDIIWYMLFASAFGKPNTLPLHTLVRMPNGRVLPLSKCVEWYPVLLQCDLSMLFPMLSDDLVNGYGILYCMHILTGHAPLPPLVETIPDVNVLSQYCHPVKLHNRYAINRAIPLHDVEFNGRMYKSIYCERCLDYDMSKYGADTCVNNCIMRLCSIKFQHNLINCLGHAAYAQYLEFVNMIAG